MTDSYTYKAFGEELSSTGTTENFSRYVGLFGYYRDLPNRLYVRFRYLDVDKAKWISRDPLGFTAGDYNVYRYVNNNPINYVDPSGANPDYVCGANLDSWIAPEIRLQETTAKKFWRKYPARGDTSLIDPLALEFCGSWGQSLLNYAGWANMNQGYKNMPELGKSVSGRCPKGDGCGRTIQLCGTCFSRDQLGNIMYGLIGAYLGYSLSGLQNVVDCLKSVLPTHPFCFAKADAYALGYEIYKSGGDGPTFCTKFKLLAPKHPEALKDCDEFGEPIITYDYCGCCSDPPKQSISGILPQNAMRECWTVQGGPNC